MDALCAGEVKLAIANRHIIASVSTQPAVVALTDDRWFRFLRTRAINGLLDEVNFWRPMGTAFKALAPGEPFFFRLKHPVNAIAGYGFFAHFTLLPVQLAWQTFERGNGDANYEGFLNRISQYRSESPAETALGHKPVGCIVLREVRFLEDRQWLAWNEDEEWRREIVAYLQGL